MAQSSLTTLYDEEGNPVTVSVQPDATYALATNDVQVRLALNEILKALKGTEPSSPWSVLRSRSPWL